MCLRGAAWCCVVLRGAAWCCVVLRGAAWYCVVLRVVAWCCVVLCVAHACCVESSVVTKVIMIHEGGEEKEERGGEVWSPGVAAQEQ